MNKQYRNSHLMISDKGIVTIKANGRVAPMGSKGYMISPGVCKTVEQMIAEVYPNVTHGNYNSDTTVCHNKGRFKKDEDNPKHVGWYVIKGAKYNSLRAAQLGTGIPFKTLSRWCKKGINDCSLVAE